VVYKVPNHYLSQDTIQEPEALPEHPSQKKGCLIVEECLNSLPGIYVKKTDKYRRISAI
jgi:hypothetical protein